MNLNAANTAIVLDSTADFPDAAERFPNWRVVPLYVNFGTESYRDGVEHDGVGVLRAAPYEQGDADDLAADAGRLQGRVRGARGVRADPLPPHRRHLLRHVREREPRCRSDRVRTIDTTTASVAITMLALAIQRRLERGTTDEEVYELVARYKDEHAMLFTVDTLEFLARGGRIGRARAFAGELLNVKPILSIRGGEVVPVKRVRGNRKAFQEFVDAVEATIDSPGLRFGTAHADAPERAAELAKMVRDLRPQATLEVETELGAVIGTHAGPGTVGLFWFTDE